jgi:hypothetical protein
LNLRVRFRILVAAFVGSLLASCNSGFGRIDQHYLLDMVDIPDDANVCYELDDGDCAERVPQTVFAVGYNKEFIVAARHPHKFEDPELNRSRTEYFYIIRSLDGPLIPPERSVRGPFDLATFERHQQRLGLPPFTREVSSLR